MEIKISKSARQCCVSGKAFSHGEEIISLIRVQQGEFVRQDYLPEAWQSELGEGAIAVWTSRYIDPKHDENHAPEEFSPLRKIFYDAVEQNSRPEMAIAYLAAQLLRRQKVFRLVKEYDQPENNAKALLFIDRLNGRFVEVRDPDLSYAELSAAQKELLEKLRSLEETPDEQSVQA